MPKIALPLVACLVALAASGASAQSYWKWRDSSGQLHMSDSPPPSNVPAKDILQRGGAGAGTAPAASPAPAASGSVDNELQKKKAAADKAAADKAALEQKNAAIRADNCQRAQQAQSAYQSGVRIARMNANGEREYLDDNQRVSEMRRLQDIISQNCGPAPATPAN